METCNFEIFHEFWEDFVFKNLILTIIKASLVGYWTFLIILKEITKPSGKFLRVWAKSQLRFEISEKILKTTYRNLNGKLFFAHFLSDFLTFVILYSLENNPIFL